MFEAKNSPFLSLKLKALTAIVLVSVLVQGTQYDTPNLTVKKIVRRGFGDRHNLYSWTMETFKGSLYIGTLNVKGGPIGMHNFLLDNGIPVATNGGEVQRGTRAEDGCWTWKRVLKFRFFKDRSRSNFGIRKLITVGEYMYGVTANYSAGFRVIRTFDGEDWEEVNTPGFGCKENTSGRGMASFGGYLYIGTENRVQGAELWRRAIDDVGDFAPDTAWEAVFKEGNGDSKNEWFSDFQEFNGELYAGTLNMNGYQLYRTSDGETWEMILEKGNGIPSDVAVMKITIYDDRMYLGTMNFEQGASLLVSTPQFGNDTKVESEDAFQYIFDKGNGTLENAYVWYMIEFAGRLYIGTFHKFGRQEFDLLSAADPINDELVTETDDAFGNRNIYGVRCMVVFDDRLIIGSASNNKPTMVFEAEANIA